MNRLHKAIGAVLFSVSLLASYGCANSKPVPEPKITAVASETEPVETTESSASETTTTATKTETETVTTTTTVDWTTVRNIPETASYQTVIAGKETAIGTSVYGFAQQTGISLAENRRVQDEEKNLYIIYDGLLYSENGIVIELTARVQDSNWLKNQEQDTEPDLTQCIVTSVSLSLPDEDTAPSDLAFDEKSFGVSDIFLLEREADVKNTFGSGDKFEDFTVYKNGFQTTLVKFNSGHVVSVITDNTI